MPLFEMDVCSEMERIHEQLNRLIDRVASQGWNKRLGDEVFRPLVDVFETSTALVVAVEIPGVDRDSISVFAKGGVLYVEGVKTSDYSEVEGALFHVFERKFGKCKVDLGIPCPVQLRDATAVYCAGVVRIEIPKIEERRRKVSVVSVSFE